MFYISESPIGLKEGKENSYGTEKMVRRIACGCLTGVMLASYIPVETFAENEEYIEEEAFLETIEALPDGGDPADAPERIDDLVSDTEFACELQDDLFEDAEETELPPEEGIEEDFSDLFSDILTLGSGLTRSFKVKVSRKAVTTRKISVASRSVRLKKGKTFDLQTKLSPVTTSQTKIRYKTSKKKIAAVSSRGVIKAKAEGSAVITVKNGSKTVKVQVTVSK